VVVGMVDPDAFTWVQYKLGLVVTPPTKVRT
jgi:hypothetical protein